MKKFFWPEKNCHTSHAQHRKKIGPKIFGQKLETLLTDGFLSGLPAANACPAYLGMVGKLLAIPTFCLPVSAEEGSSAPVEKQGVVIQKVFDRDGIEDSQLVRKLRCEAAVKCAAFQILIEPFLHAHHGGNLFLQQTKAVAAPAHTVGWIGDFGVGMVHMEERLCFRSGVRPGKRHLQDVERG